MKVLVACEESQRVCSAFRALGHEAYSCDIQEPSGGHPEWHILGDVLKVLGGGNVVTMDDITHSIGKWDIIIAFPPCTYLSNAGARHLYKGGQLNIERYKKGLEAKKFLMMIYTADCPRIAIENPTPSRIYELPEKTQVIQPYMFGHPFTKRTLLWLKGLPKLEPTKIVDPERSWCPNGAHKHNEKYNGVHSKERSKNRSKTFAGIAQAMAVQWGGLADDL